MAKPNKVYLRGLEQAHLHEIARHCFVETLRPSIATSHLRVNTPPSDRRTAGYLDVGFVVVSCPAISRVLSRQT